MAVSLRCILLCLFALISLAASSEGELVLKQSQHKASAHSKKRSKAHSKTHSRAKDVDDDDTHEDDNDAAVDENDDDSSDAKDDEVDEQQNAAANGQVALKAEGSSEGAGEAAGTAEGEAKAGAQTQASSEDGSESEAEDSEDNEADEKDAKESHSSEVTEVQKAKTEFEAAKNAVLLNTREEAHTKLLLRTIDDKAAQEQEIQTNVDAVASQTQSKALAKFLGDMWKEMRLFAKPFYKEHLEEKLEDLQEASPNLRKRLDEATSVWNKVKEEA